MGAWGLMYAWGHCIMGVGRVGCGGVGWGGAQDESRDVKAAKHVLLNGYGYVQVDTFTTGRGSLPLLQLCALMAGRAASTCVGLDTGPDVHPAMYIKASIEANASACRPPCQHMLN